MKFSFTLTNGEGGKNIMLCFVLVLKWEETTLCDNHMQICDFLQPK